MTAVGTDARPDVVWMVEWTDLFEQRRMALSLHERDVDALRSVDPDARIVKGHVTWEVDDG